MNKASKPYGISVSLPENDPMSAAHLLGDEWMGMRWFETPQQRDTAYEEMLDHPRYYRIGDAPSVLLKKIDPD
ncbi:MAG: hypothetical protein KTR35_05610 [Gammaproteobacteria bacterium]|nr:hypothetical protein [Gammaproteobacteria bacterium]